MAKLGLNVDHVATVRQARGGMEPDPVTAAALGELAGAEGITIHLREDRRHIQDRDLEILRTEFPEVDKVSARVQGPGQYNLSHGRDFLNNAAVVGSDPEYREIMNVRVLDGRFLNDTDLRERRKVIVVDKNVRDVLFHGQSPVGQHLLVNGTSYSIIGVFEMDQFGSYTFTFIPLLAPDLSG